MAKTGANHCFQTTGNCHGQRPNWRGMRPYSKVTRCQVVINKNILVGNEISWSYPNFWSFHRMENLSCYQNLKPQTMKIYNRTGVHKIDFFPCCKILNFFPYWLLSTYYFSFFFTKEGRKMEKMFSFLLIFSFFFTNNIFSIFLPLPLAGSI